MAEVVSTQNSGADTVSEEIIGSQGQTETIVLVDDEEYLEAYFNICRGIPQKTPSC